MSGAVQAGVDHRRAGRGKRAGAMHDHRDVGQRFARVLRMLQVEDPAFQAEQAAEGMHSRRVASAEDRLEPLALRFEGE